jgi:hypothetical protein
MAIILVIVSGAALASQPSNLTPDAPSPLCYCHCAYEGGAKHCTKMCELPQFENRWWAVSCHKKNSTASGSSAPALRPGSKKTNRREQAAR